MPKLKKISFIHAADLHLDSPFQGLAHTPQHIFQDIQSSTFTALENLVQTAIKKQVDFVLLVGDLFDNEKQSLKAQIRLRKAFEELQSYNILVYLSYGNHDHINGNIHPVEYPENVLIFPDEKVRQFIYKRDGEEIATIHGFSYEHRAVTQKKIEEYQVNHVHIPFHIATLHGSLQSNLEHDTYAPFQIHELIDKGFDYWALGHIHQKEIIKKDPLIVYSGNTQGRHRKEEGEKGCFYVELTESDSDITFIPLQTIQFTSLSINVSTCKEIHDLEKVIQQTLKTEQPNFKSQLIELYLISNDDEHQIWEKNHYFEEIIEVVNDSNIHSDGWIYIYKYNLKVKKTDIDIELYEGDHFMNELATHFENISISPFLRDLFNHQQGRKFLNTFTGDEEEFIKSKARQLLVSELLNKNEG